MAASLSAGNHGALAAGNARPKTSIQPKDTETAAAGSRPATSNPVATMSANDAAITAAIAIAGSAHLSASGSAAPASTTQIAVPKRAHRGTGRLAMSSANAGS